MLKTALLIFLLPVLLFFACNEAPPADVRLDKFSKAYCECAGPLVALNDEAEAMLADTARSVELMQKMSAIEQQYEQTRECLSSVLARYGKLQGADVVAFEQRLQAQCPGLSGKRELLRELIE